MPGSFVYAPAAGTVLGAGNNQALSVSFTPTDTTDYAGASGSASINVLKATPTITWANPANIVFGTALGSTQLNATASWTSGGNTVNVPGSFVYTPAAGTVLGAGNNQTLSVSFTPTDTTDYAGASGSASINVLKATPTITWANPANIVFGTALGSTQLNATASWTSGGNTVNVPGSFVYTPAAGTVLGAGNNQALSVSFTPTDTTDYAGASGSASINVLKATPTITWANPANIVYGTALGSTQLNATASWTSGGNTVNVPGSFVYTPAAGTVLGAGNNQALSVSFTPTDTTDYAGASGSASINVLKATPTIIWANPANIVYRTALGSTQLNATASWTSSGNTVNVPGSFVYTPAAGTVLGAGNNQTLSVSFTPTDTTDYSGASGTASINVLKAAPMITWANPANIVFGTALGSTQLNATASWTSGRNTVNVPGSFIYTPAAGTVLAVGNNQTLSASFAPTDTIDYTTAAATVTISVVPSTSNPTLTAINFSATVKSTPVAMNGSIYFTASDSAHGQQLWSSNGTSGGTVMLTDVNPTYGGCSPSDLTVVGNTLYFVANDGRDGPQLWSSNGTSSGTVMVTDVQPGIGLFPSDLTAVNGVLDFVAYDPVDGYQLYTSNGTASGTVLVADIGGTAGSDPSDLTAVGSTVYFSATDGVHGYQLWKSNGTASGTVMVADIDGTVGSYPDELTAVGSSIDFAAFDAVHGYQLWTSNGTASGTVMLTSSNASSGGFAPSSLTAVGSTLFCAGNDGVHGYQLWTSNGTASGTVMLTSSNASGGGLSPASLTTMGSTLFFSGDDGVHGSQLWSSDGTSGGTTMVADLNGTAGSDPGYLTVANGTLYFSAYTSKTGSQVWQSNGSSAGTTMVADLNGSAGCNPSNLMAAGSSLYFTATGATLWQLSNSSNVGMGMAGVRGGSNLMGLSFMGTTSFTTDGDLTPATAGKPKAGIQLRLPGE